MSDQSFARKLEDTYGPRISKNCIIKRLRPLKTVADFKRFTTQYARDITKANYVSPDQVSAQLEPGADYEDLILAGKAPLRAGDGQHYIFFGNGLWYFGSASTSLITSETDLFKFPDDDRLELITNEWMRKAKGLCTVAHHLVASLDPRICNRLVRASYPADAVVISSIVDAMHVFGSRYYPGETLDMLCGVHHDRAHIHAHCLVHPRTDGGRRINMTLDGSRIIDGTKYRLPYQETLKQAYGESVKALCEAIFPAQRMQEKRRDRTRMATFEDLILSGRCVAEPSFFENQDSPPPLKYRLAGFRDMLLSAPDYFDIICTARRDQAKAAPARLKACGKDYITHNLGLIHESLKVALEPVTMASEDLFFNAGALKKPELAVGPFHRRGIGRALSRSGWASKQGIDTSNKPAAQVARRFVKLRARLKACRNANAALASAASGLELASNRHYAWAVFSVAQVLTGAAGWLNKLEPHFSEWKPSSDGKSRLQPRMKLVNSIDAELEKLCREISQRYRPITVNELELYSKAAPHVEDEASLPRGESEVEQTELALDSSDAEAPKTDFIGNAKVVPSAFDVMPGRILIDDEIDDPFMHIAASHTGSVLSVPMKVQLEGLLTMAPRQLKNEPQGYEPEF
jgi:hypothetical protein